MTILIDTLFDTKNEIKAIRAILGILFSKEDVEELYGRLNQQEINDVLFVLINKLIQKTDNKEINLPIEERVK